MEHGPSGVKALLLLAVAGALLLELAAACGDHDEHGVSHWSKTVEYRGRRRSLLSMQGRK